MSSIDRDSVLAAEKDKLYETACGSEGKIRFEEIDPSADTYFKDYKACRHLGSPLAVYDSQELSQMREMLGEIWGDDPVKKACIPVMLAAYRKTREDQENHLPEIDLHNYMM